MTIFSLYIFDRHCECIYYQDWHRTRTLRVPPTSNFKPGVLRLPNSPAIPATGSNSTPAPSSTIRESIFGTKSTSNGIDTVSVPNGQVGAGGGGRAVPKGLAFDEEAKLVYGVVLSLKNMVKKLSGKDEAFTSFRTPQYKLHLYETVTGYKFILLSDPLTDSLRFVLRQLHVGPFIDHVVRNPLVELDSREVGIDNDLFRAAVDRHIRGLSMFGS